MAYQEEQDTQFTPKASLIDNLVNKYKSLANSLPRDSFIDNLVSDTENDDSSLSDALCMNSPKPTITTPIVSSNGDAKLKSGLHLNKS